MTPTILVTIRPGLTIPHTQAQYDQLWAGVDPDIARAMDGFNKPKPQQKVF